MDIIAMFKNFDCLLRTGGRDRLVACFLKQKFQILTGENLILNNQNGAHTTSTGGYY